MTFRFRLPRRPVATLSRPALLLAMVLALPLALAGNPARAAGALRVFACEPEWGALATEIGGDRVQAYVATGAHQDPHHVDARPSLIAQLRQADLVVCTGASLEAGWLPVLLTRSANPALRGDRLFYAAEKVALLGGSGAPVDRGQGDVHAAGNPHVHLDPRRMMDIGDALAKTLGQADAGNAALYTQRATAFRARLSRAMAGWNTAALRDRNYFVFHEAWPYLLDWLHVRQAGALEPLPGVPPASQHLAKLAAQARVQPVDGIIHASYDDARAVAWLARQAGTCAIELPYTVGGSPQAKDLPSFYGDLVARLNRNCQ